MERKVYHQFWNDVAHIRTKAREVGNQRAYVSKEEKMKNEMSKKVASACASVLRKTMFLCANSTSSCGVYQEKAPKSLSKMSIVKK